MYIKDKDITKVYKEDGDDFVFVYTSGKYRNEICKEYYTIYREQEKKDRLISLRKKLLAMKNRKNWPSYVIQPTNVGRMNTYHFVTRFPFIEGTSLLEYLKSHDISLKDCALFLKNLEGRILSEKDMVFPDVSNPSNIILTSNNILDYIIIDPDDIQFDGYSSKKISLVIYPTFEFKSVRGLDKCYDSEKIFNKQLDVRSIYGLFYKMMNGANTFYPIFSERNSIEEYVRILEELNIPTSSSLFKKSLITVSDKANNESLGNSLFELAEDGYEFETYDHDSTGYKHVLIKK